MTRKDYLIIAKVIKKAKRYVIEMPRTGTEVVQYVISQMIEEISLENKKFNSDKFIESIKLS